MQSLIIHRVAFHTVNQLIFSQAIDHPCPTTSTVFTLIGLLL